MWPDTIAIAERLFRNPRLLPVVGADPGANVEISIPVPDNKLWLPQSFFVALVTDATVANRRVFFRFRDPTAQRMVEWNSQVDQAASLTYQYSIVFGGAAFFQALMNLIVTMFVPDYPLLENWTIETSTLNRAVGDNFGAPRLLVVEYES